MAGCDYLPSLKGMGISKAVSFLYKYVKIDTTVKKLKLEKTFKDQVPDGNSNL